MQVWMFQMHYAVYIVDWQEGHSPCKTNLLQQSRDIPLVKQALQG